MPQRSSGRVGPSLLRRVETVVILCCVVLFDYLDWAHIGIYLSSKFDFIGATAGSDLVCLLYTLLCGKDGRESACDVLLAPTLQFQ